MDPISPKTLHVFGKWALIWDIPRFLFQYYILKIDSVYWTSRTALSFNLMYGSVWRSFCDQIIYPLRIHNSFKQQICKIKKNLIKKSK